MDAARGWMVRVAEEEFFAQWTGEDGARVIISVDEDGASYTFKRAGETSFTAGSFIFEKDTTAALAEILSIMQEPRERNAPDIEE